MIFLNSLGILHADLLCTLNKKEARVGPHIHQGRWANCMQEISDKLKGGNRPPPSNQTPDGCGYMLLTTSGNTKGVNSSITEAKQSTPCFPSSMDPNARGIGAFSLSSCKSSYPIHYIARAWELNSEGTREQVHFLFCPNVHLSVRGWTLAAVSFWSQDKPPMVTSRLKRAHIWRPSVSKAIVGARERLPALLLKLGVVWLE